MIISVHIPRTAGSSFRAYLRESPDINLVGDYGSPIMVPAIIRNAYASFGRLKQWLKPLDTSIDCLHGHFLPVKYKGYIDKPEVKFITWLREPADRIRSQYDYCFQSNKAVDKSPFQNKVARQSWSFEAFYTSRQMRNLYTKFLWKFPIENMDFIGIVEHYEEDFHYICQHYFNDINPTFTYGNRTKSEEILDDERRQIEHLNQRDYALYRHGLSLRHARLNQVDAMPQQSTKSNVKEPNPISR